MKPFDKELPDKMITKLKSALMLSLSAQEDEENSPIEFFVGAYKGLKMGIHFSEHPPPHFFVKYQGKKANFCIEKCNRLKGNRGLERFDTDIKIWWQEHHKQLVKLWNESRPSDCPVGPIKE